MRRSALYYVLVLAAAAVFLAVWLGRDEKLAAWSERYIAKSHAAQKAAHAREYVAVWLPRAALINLGICALLLAGGPWLARREAAPAAETMPQEPSLTAQRLLWVVTAGAVLSSALLNYPRLSQSLWGDEENTMRRSVLGEYNAGPDGALAWSAVEWGGSVWNYRDPNNHPCFSVLAKLSHALWPPADDPAGWYFHEAGLRLPAYLFGLAGLAALALLAQAVRMPGAGVLAVVWLALHPWHVRYGVDARGYALLFVWIPLSMLSLWRAAHGGRWIWWICYGVLEFLILWSYPGAVYFLLALNLSALALLLRKGLPPAWRAMGLKRWVVANAVGAMLTVQLMLPLVPPMLLYLQRSRIRGQLTADWLTDSASQMLSGIHFWDPGKLTVGESWARLGQERPWLMASVFGVVLIALLLGVFRFWRQGSGHRSLLWVLLLPAPFMVLLSAASGNILYPWYVLIGLPGLALLVGGGLAQAAAWLHGPVSRPVACLLPVGGLILFGFGTAGQNAALRRHSAEPNRESIAAIRTERNPRTADLSRVMTLALVMHTKGYDPAAILIQSAAELEENLREADRKETPCFVHFADWGLAERDFPEVLAALQDGSRFEALAPFRGLESYSTRFVFRYKGAAWRKLNIKP